MNRVIRFVALAALLQFLMIPLRAIAEEQVPTEQEIMQAEDEPPVIPHRVSESDTFKDCLKCHESGKKGAPMTSHPERKNCTQCHVAGEVKVKAGKKGKKIK